jgi:hypothetical protein
MPKEITKEIQDIAAHLKQENKVNLAKHIEENWNKTLLEYSKKINSYKTKQKIEPIMQKAFKTELARLEYKTKEINKIIKQLEKSRFIQTAPHTSPAQKPRYFFINYLSSLSLNKNSYSIVAMFSGVPFSNKTRPGRICSEEKEHNLVPSSMQDALVYNYKINKNTLDLYNKLEQKIKDIALPPKDGESYTKWALLCVQKIEEKALDKKMVFLDFNQIAKNYILQAFQDKEHFVNKLLFTKKGLDSLEKHFPNEVFFYGNIQKGKYLCTTSYYIKDGELNDGKNIIKINKKILSKMITQEELCIGLPLGFLFFSFLNHFMCGGSFAQVEYLPIYKKKFLEIKIPAQYNINSAPSGILTTGGFRDDLSIHTIDVLIKKKNLNKYKDTLFGVAIIAIKDVLLKQNYSHNMIK